MSNAAQQVLDLVNIERTSRGLGPLRFSSRLNDAATLHTQRRAAGGDIWPWMKSTGHCKNILNPAFTEIGVGYVTGGVRYNRFWTQVFARPIDVHRPVGTYNPAWC